MGNAEEYQGSGGAETRYVDSSSIRRLTVSTCMLVVTTMCTLFILHCQRKDEDERLVRASQLAEERLDEIMEKRETIGAGNFPPSGEEWIVSTESGQRFIRTVEILPEGAGGTPERVTVTVGWETIAGKNRVVVHGRIGGDAGRPAGELGASVAGEIREALSP